MNPVLFVFFTFHFLNQLLVAVAAVGLVSSAIFLLMTLLAARRFLQQSRAAQAIVDRTLRSSLPPVSILKPVHGAEEELAGNLQSFFEQDYPDYEVIFGVRDPENPAAQVAEEVRARYPHIRSQIIFSGPPEWPNAKIFSLDKMIAASSRSYFIISDSDVRVSPDFLRNTIVPLLDPKVGLITCMYRGIPAADFWSTLEALGLSVEMCSGVMVADMLEGMRFALGPAMAVRRDAIEAIGGIASTAEHYSDDFELGNRIWAKGYRVLLSHHFVRNVLTKRPLLRTLGDQLRWMKSTRYSRPAGHVGTGLTYAVPYGILGLIGFAGLGNWPLGVAFMAAAWLNRMIQAIAVGWGVARDPRALTLCWLYPMRDLLGFFTWIASFTSRKFFWRGETYRFEDGGRIVALQRPPRFKPDTASPVYESVGDNLPSRR
jgi:ceramide glucosyltransferase